MLAILLLLGVVMGIAAWWLLQQGLMSKPWLEEAPADEISGRAGAGESPALPAAKVGLWVFLVVAGSLLALFVSAYQMRMNMGDDWRPLPKPTLLWLNTGVLVLGSIALHRAQTAARQGSLDEMRSSLLAGGGCAVAFLVGQLLAWRQLAAAGYALDTNPADAFFYVITAVHGVHVLGGLVALGRTVVTTRRRSLEPERVRLSIELCAIYWHFVLLVWLVLFGLLLLT